MNPSPIVDFSLEQRRLQKEWDALQDQYLPGWAAFDWDDVTFYGDTPEPGPDHIAVCGPAALAALRQRMAACGVVQHPTTYRQLLAVLAYCEELARIAHETPEGSPENQATWQTAVLQTARTYTPELVASFEAFARGDIVELQRISREVLTLDVMASHFVMAKKSWIGTPGLAYLAMNPDS